MIAPIGRCALAAGRVFAAAQAAGAADLDSPALPPGLTRDELFARLDGRGEGSAGLTGLFKHP